MRHVGVLLAVYAAGVLQTVWGSVWLDFLGLALVVVLLAFEGWTGIVWAGVIGLLGDCLAGERLGVEMFWAVSAVLVIPRGATRGLGGVTVVSFVVMFVVRAGSVWTRAVLDGRPVEVGTVVENVAVTAGCSAVLVAGLLLTLRCVRWLASGRRGEESVPIRNRWAMLTEE